MGFRKQNGVYSMYIYEVPIGAELSLEVKSKGMPKPFCFTCTIVNVSMDANCVFVAPITSDGKLVSFEAPELFIQAVLLIDNKPTIWRGCSVQYVKTKKERFHAIICKTEGAIANRRRFFRLPVVEFGKVHMGANAYDAIVRDISSGGFCFSLEKYNGRSSIDVVELMYKDSIVGKDVKIRGQVVRQVDEDGQTTFGCYMAPRADIDKYIANRQQRSMKIKIKDLKRQ